MSLDIRRYVGERLGRGRPGGDRPMTHDWDVVVVGLGALGLGDRLLGVAPAGRPRAGARAVRDRPPQRRVRGREPDHPPLLPPARLRPADRARLRVVGRGRARERAPGRVPDRRPGRRAAGHPRGRRDRHRRVRAGDDRRRRAVRDARRRRRSCVAGRRGGSATSTSGCSRPTAGSRTRPPATSPTGGSRRPRARSCASTHRWRGSRAATARRPSCSRTARSITAGKVVIAADAWTNDLLDPLGAHLPLTVTQEQVSWFTPRGDPALFDKDRFPIWIWMDEPSFYGFPTHGHPGPKVGQDVGGRPVTPATRTFERDDEALARVTTSSRPTCRRWRSSRSGSGPACTR